MPGDRCDSPAPLLEINQTIVVYTAGGDYVAVGAIDRQQYAVGPHAEVVLQKALDLLAAAGGGRLTIERGNYMLPVALLVPGNVIINGAGNATRFYVPEENAAGIGLMVAGTQGVVLCDFAVDGERAGTAGVVLDKCVDCTVDRVTVRGFGRYGFCLRHFSSFCKLHNCTAYDNAEANYLLDELCAWLEPNDVPGCFCPNYVSNCHAYAGGVGFEVRNSVCQNIVACMAYNSGSHGFAVTNYSPSTLISGCRSFQGRGNGVLVADSPEINISSSIFCWHEGHGIELSNVTWGTVSANEIMDAGTADAENHKHALYLHRDVKGIQISGNSIFTWADQHPTIVSIYEDESCRDNCIVGNNVNYYRDAALVTQGSNTLSAYVHAQPTAYPNPNLEPFAQPLPNYGSGHGRFDDSRMRSHLLAAQSRTGISPV